MKYEFLKMPLMQFQIKTNLLKTMSDITTFYKKNKDLQTSFNFRKISSLRLFLTENVLAPSFINARRM
jgi:hypothetical protein